MAMANLLAALVILIFANGAFALQPAELVGRWTVSWPKTQTRNSISFRSEKSGLSGSYTSDDGKVCEVAGNLSEENELLLLQIKCADWDVELKGNVSPDGGSVTGFYVYHHQRANNDLDRFYLYPSMDRSRQIRDV
jgi:hypothetical protein